jgi:transcriptional regulator with XRE-family HTH domain
MTKRLDYRDALQHLFDELRHTQGITLAQISKRSGMSEQIITGVLRKERNLSAQSLTKLLTRIGYAIAFERHEPPLLKKDAEEVGGS